MRSGWTMVVAALGVVANLWSVGPAQITDYCRCVDHDCRQQWCIKDLLPE